MASKVLEDLRQRLQPSRHAEYRPPPLPRKLECLSQAQLFSDFTPQELAELERRAPAITFKRGQVFYEPGQTVESLYVLKRGRVNVYRLSVEGKKFITGTAGPGTVFGEMPLLGQSLYGGYAEAAQDSQLCVLSRADVEHLLLTKPSFDLRVIELLSLRVQQLEARLEWTALKRIPARLAAVLLEMAGPDGGAVAGISHQELADMVGVYRETITRILDDWQGQQLIEMGRLQVTIADPEALRAIVET
jgi:CRP/FNR family cyclic AMP-dependent transcriptional regulator